MDKKTKKIIKNIKTELAKLKDVEDEDVKQLYQNVSKEVERVTIVEKKEETDSKEEEEVKEEKTKESEEKEDSEEEETEKESEEDDDVEEEEEVDKEKKEEPKEEEVNNDDEPEDETELSMEVSKKLKEASIELNNLKDEVETKEEVIKSYKSKITELKKELKDYREKEQVELAKKLDTKVNKLIELYSNLGINKDAETLKKTFKEEQIDKLIIDLSAVSNESAKKPGRQTELSADLELGKYSKSDKQKQEKKLDAGQTAKMLFDL